MKARSLRVQAGTYAASIAVRQDALRAAHFGTRLLAHDDSLWGSDPAHRKVAANRLGWLDAPVALRAKAAELKSFAAEVAREGYAHAVLLGMGGSSLAPDVFRLTFGVAPGALALTMLDNTSPAAVKAVTDALDLSRTLFIVASKSGGTIEVSSFEKHFFALVQGLRGAEAGRSFVAITDPGTSLEQLAKDRGYRRTFNNPPDIGGRYSALSYFGLVPAALIGVDVDALLASTAAELDALRADDGDAVALGAALGELARAGRDKLTIVASPALASVGMWIEQLVAESTGKSGRGIVPVAEETLAAPEAYGADRVFVAMSSPSLPADTSRALDALAAAGHPVFRWESPALTDLGADMLRWEIATAAASAVLEVDPFDEPNVSEAKAATQAVLQKALADGRFPERAPSATSNAMAAFVPASAASPGADPAAWLAALVALVKPGDYVALLAYLLPRPARVTALQALRHAIRSRTKAATTLGIGPRFLHSTGQLHKGGANNGVFLQLTADEGDLPIPGEPYGFGVLRAAQAAGDFEVLEKRGRRVLRVHLGPDVDAALAALVQALPQR